jgi:hypothetical protein
VKLFLKNSYLRFAEARRIRRIISEGTVDVQGWRHLVELIESSCRRRYLEPRHHKPTEWLMFGDMQISLGRGRVMNFNVLRVGVTYNPFTKKVTVNHVRFSEPVAELRRQYYMSRGIFIAPHRGLQKPRERKPDDEVSPWDRPKAPAPPPRDVAHVSLRPSMESSHANVFQREPRTIAPHEPRLYFPKPAVRMKRPPWYHI